MATNVSSVVSHFPDVENGFTTTLASTISSGATTVPLNSVAGYTNGQPAVFVVDPSDVTKKQTLTGIIDTAGIQVTSVVWTAGTNQTHTGGATVVDYATATHIAMISKGIQVHSDQDGTLKAGAVDVAAVLASDVVTNPKIINGAVTPSKIDLDPTTASVVTDQTTTSTSYTNLATVGPATTVTIGANGLALVSFGCNGRNTSTANERIHIGVAVSGATTINPTVTLDDPDQLQVRAASTSFNYPGNKTILMTGLTPGSTTFTLKYATNSGTGTFGGRYINVVPL